VIESFLSKLGLNKNVYPEETPINPTAAGYGDGPEDYQRIKNELPTPSEFDPNVTNEAVASDEANYEVPSMNSRERNNWIINLFRSKGMFSFGDGRPGVENGRNIEIGLDE
jgi:hypothetical protein